jgi:hypothetical protein
MASMTRAYLIKDLHQTRRAAACALGLWFAAFAGVAEADEGGVSFWLPGQYGSFAASPLEPGWSFETTYYHASAAATAGASFERSGVTLQAGITSPSDLIMFTPTYVFSTPVFGAQAALGMSIITGRNATSAAATLTGPGGASISGMRSDEVVGFADLSPSASLTWTRDVHNFMVYATSGIPTGAYDTTRLSNLGIGHWAIDSGGGYTYLNEKAGFEWSAVLGFTYNFINPYTQYQNGIDAHLDWAVSPYLTDKMHIGAVGYFYNQLSGDSGSGARLGAFESRVAGIGPQIGFFFPLAGQQGYLNFRGYYEFDAKNRLDGWTGWITLFIEPPEKKSAHSAGNR